MKTHPEYPALAPCLTVDDAAKAIDFYKTAFGAEELYRLIDPGDGKVGHAEVLIEGQLFMVSDEYPGINKSPKTLGGTAASLVLMVADVDEAHRSAVAAGATSERAPQDQFYGHRMAVVIDPCGHRWMLQREIEKVSPEEMQRRWDAMGSEGCGSSGT